MNFNKIIILGRLTNNPENKTLPSGQALTSFTVATNRVYTDKNGAKQESTEFHNVITFAKLADICARYLTKGRLVLIEGRLQTRSWQDANGIKRYRTEIIAENMQMGPKQQSDTSSHENQIPQEEIPVIEADAPISPENENNYTESQENSTNNLSDNEDAIKVKDIPF